MGEWCNGIKPLYYTISYLVEISLLSRKKVILSKLEIVSLLGCGLHYPRVCDIDITLRRMTDDVISISG